MPANETTCACVSAVRVYDSMLLYLFQLFLFVFFRVHRRVTSKMVGRNIIWFSSLSLHHQKEMRLNTVSLKRPLRSNRQNYSTSQLRLIKVDRNVDEMIEVIMT